MVNQNSRSQVDFLTSNLEKNQNFVLIKIDKTTHQSLETLRRELRKAGGVIKVIKNTFLEKAVNQMSLKNKAFLKLKKDFFPVKEPSAMLFLDKTWDAGLKAFNEYLAKEKTLSYKLSLLDNEVYDSASTAKIAKLPSRGELVAKILGSMKAPAAHTVYALKYNTNKLVYILQAKAKEVKS